jgi:hypothetical protein
MYPEKWKLFRIYLEANTNKVRKNSQAKIKVDIRVTHLMQRTEQVVERTPFQLTSKVTMRIQQRISCHQVSTNSKNNHYLLQTI